MQINSISNINGINIIKKKSAMKNSLNFSSLSKDNSLSALSNARNINFDGKDNLISCAHKLYVEANQIKKVPQEQMLDKNSGLTKRIVRTKDDNAVQVLTFNPEKDEKASYSYLFGRLVSASFSRGNEVKTFSYSWGEDALTKAEVKTLDEKGEYCKTFNYDYMGNVLNIAVEYGKNI